MSLHFRCAAHLLLVFVAVVSPVSGQATGVPVRNAGVSQGISVEAEAGFGRVRRSAGDDDVSRALAATARAGFGPFGGALGISRATINPAAGPDLTTTAVSAAAQLTVFGGPLVPLKITWQAGASRLMDGGQGSPWRGHLGIGGALTIPAVAFSIRSWIAPRFDYLANQPVSGERIKGAVSAGIDLGLLNGLGLRVSYDSRLGWENGNERAKGIGLGASYHFR